MVYVYRMFEMFSIYESLEDGKENHMWILKEGEEGTRSIALLGQKVGPQHTSPLFVFVSLETSDSSAEWTADVFLSVCAWRSGHTKLVTKSFWLMG